MFPHSMSPHSMSWDPEEARVTPASFNPTQKSSEYETVLNYSCSRFLRARALPVTLVSCCCLTGSRGGGTRTLRNATVYMLACVAPPIRARRRKSSRMCARASPEPACVSTCGHVTAAREREKKKRKDTVSDVSPEKNTENYVHDPPPLLLILK